MKTVIIGASGHSTPALFDTAVPLGDDAHAFTLVARNKARLGAVSRAIATLSAARGSRVRQELASLSDLNTALHRADVAIVQIRPGGYEARNWDERFPHRYGVCGDEGLGVGGLAAAWRTWPALREILATIASASPRALVLLLTSPVGILTRCALNAFPELRLYGICELPWTTLVDLCDRDPAAAREASFSYIGVNHVGWFANVELRGRPMLDTNEVLALKYVALANETGAVLRAQMDAPSRATALAASSASAFAAYASGGATEIATAVRSRATPWYADAVAPLLAGLAGADVSPVFFLTQRNASYCSWLDDDDVVEMPYTLRSSRLERRTLGTWPRDDIAARLTSFVRYEGLAADAVTTRDTAALSGAIAMHPWMQGVCIDDALVRDVIAVPGTQAGATRHAVAV